jgi:stringent starvation protein B
VLNVSPSAVRGLDVGNDFLTFDARFGGVPMDVFVPLYAVIGIYARENGEGLLFDEELPADPEPTPPKPEPAVKRPSLKVVK